jgi:DNA ligase-associated metallophosphoesterase
MEIRIFDCLFTLLSRKAIYLKDFQALLIADLHLGKVNHFRKSGIPVPAKANDRNTEALIDLINTTEPREIIFLGDLFHSHYNEEWQVVGQVVDHFSGCRFELIKGNHDIMGHHQYDRYNIQVNEQKMLGSFILTHHPLEEVPAGAYNLAGHIHPGAQLRGKARQSMTLPCFYFGQQHGILPAFGSFTGLARIQITKGDRVFVVAQENVIEL